MRTITATISAKPPRPGASLLCGLPRVSPGRLSFASSGELFIHREIRSLLGAYASEVKRPGDSEVLFWQVMKMMDAYGSPETALAMALDEIRTVWLSCKGAYPGLKAPYRDLGLFLAAPDSITVLCGAPGAVSWTASPAKAVFDSAPSDAGAWNAMKASEIARARLAGGRVKLTFRKVAA